MKPEEIVRLLPEVFQRTWAPDTPLAGLIAAMAGLIDPIERTLDRLDASFDPHRTPDAFVTLLASWVDMDRVGRDPARDDDTDPAFPPGLGRLRALCAAAADLARTRGTAAGLKRFLETATGCRGFRIAEGVTGPDRRPRPFHLTLHAPASARRFEVFLENLIRLEKPAHCTFELTFEPQGARP